MTIGISNHGKPAENPQELLNSLDKSLISPMRILLSAKDLHGGQELIDALNSINPLAQEFP